MQVHGEGARTCRRGFGAHPHVDRALHRQGEVHVLVGLSVRSVVCWFVRFVSRLLVGVVVIWLVIGAHATRRRDTARRVVI
jgi:hypothetical protein